MTDERLWELARLREYRDRYIELLRGGHDCEADLQVVENMMAEVKKETSDAV